MAILLYEQDLYERCRIYATDVNEVVLKKAKDGIFPSDLIKEYDAAYVKAGGKTVFSDYYRRSTTTRSSGKSSRRTSFSRTITW